VSRIIFSGGPDIPSGKVENMPGDCVIILVKKNGSLDLLPILCFMILNILHMPVIRFFFE
jgi:hypothetical protein